MIGRKLYPDEVAALNAAAQTCSDIAKASGNNIVSVTGYPRGPQPPNVHLNGGDPAVLLHEAWWDGGVCYCCYLATDPDPNDAGETAGGE